jgi:hypothetical protein
MWREPVNYAPVVASGGLAGALDFRFSKKGDYNVDVSLGDASFSLDAGAGGGMAWHGHHTWPKFVGGADAQPLMTVRGALHISILHPALLAFLKAAGHNITTAETSPANQVFITRLRTDAAFRQQVALELKLFYQLVNTQTDPQMPANAYEKGIDYSRRALGGP